MGSFFRDDRLVRQIREVFADETSPATSYRVRLHEGEIVWHHAAAEPPRTFHQEPEASWWRRLAATIIGLLTIESQLCDRPTPETRRAPFRSQRHKNCTGNTTTRRLWSMSPGGGGRGCARAITSSTDRSRRA